MRVLYVSKALAVGAYRDKLRALGEHVDIQAVVPRTWGRQRVDPVVPGEPVALHDVVFGGYNHFHVYRSARAMLRDARPDFVHIDEEPYSAVTAQLMWHCRRLGIPCCFFAAQNLDVRIPPPFGRLRAWVFRNADGGLACTEAAAQVLRERGFRGRLAVIPQLGVNPDLFQASAEARRRVRAELALDGSFVIGYGGRLIPEKGLPHLIRAFAAQPENTRLVLIGDGPQRAELEAAASEAGVRARVHFVGQVLSTAMPAWLSALDTLVLPSIRLPRRMEQFGRILVEAMACAVPVIGSSCGEIPRVIGDAGVVVPEADVPALTAAIGRLRENVVERARLGDAGRSRALEQFTNDVIAALTARFYGEFVRQP